MVSRGPRAGETVTVEYLETLAWRGNLGRNLVTEVMTPIYRRRNGAAWCYNVIPATNGADRETLEHAKLQAPAELRSLWKAVTKNDYKALAEGFPGVAKAQVLDANDCANIRYYQVNMAVAPDGGGLPSPLLKHELAEFIESRKVITIEVNLFDRYRPVRPLRLSDGQPRMCVAGGRRSMIFLVRQTGVRTVVYFSDVVSLIDGPGVSHRTMFSPQRDIESAWADARWVVHLDEVAAS